MYFWKLLLPLFSFGAVSAHAIELGDPVNEAVALHLTQGGLSQIGNMVEALLPEEIEVGGGASTLECSDGDAKPLSYDIKDLVIRIAADQVEVKTDSGRLVLNIFATIWSDPSHLDVSGDCSILQGLDERCDIELPVTSLSAALSLEIQEKDGRFDVTATDPVVNISPMGNPLSNCTPASAVGTLLGQDESYLSDLILSFVEPELQGVSDSLESALEDALGQLTISTSLDIGGKPIQLEFYPTLVKLDDAGLVLGMGAQIDVEDPADCVAWEDGFAGMDAGWPVFAEKAEGTQLGYHAGLFIGRDFVDQMMFSLWANGTLCMEVSDLNGASLTAGLLKPIWGEALAEALDEDATAILQVDPRSRPFVEFSDDDPVFHLKLDDLALNLMTDLDYRTTRIFEAGVEGDVGISIDLTTEAVAVDLVFGEASLDFRDNWTKLAEPGYSGVVSEMAQVAIKSLLPDDLLPQVTLPSLLGMELDAVVWIPMEDEAWHAGYVLVDTSNVEPIQLEGCSADALGCDGSSSFEFDLMDALGCGDGSELGCSESGSACTTIPIPLGRIIPLGLLLIGLGFRRKSGCEI